MFFMKNKSKNEQIFDKTINKVKTELNISSMNFYDISKIYENGVKELKEINKNEAIDSKLIDSLVLLKNSQLNFINKYLSSIQFLNSPIYVHAESYNVEKENLKSDLKLLSELKSFYSKANLKNLKKLKNSTDIFSINTDPRESVFSSMNSVSRAFNPNNFSIYEELGQKSESIAEAYSETKKILNKLDLNSQNEDREMKKYAERATKFYIGYYNFKRSAFFGNKKNDNSLAFYIVKINSLIANYSLPNSLQNLIDINTKELDQMIRK
ncbi:MAG: hypothetical protein M1168_03440 [Candidatus Marsarchaeota archaeon]|nr:hypothetical protein [Candidatus Marsarchaeota archaeon]MCL5095008.1 hypothetical protein [Candidatus Marsarchaeota archaeon]